jgi:SSS family solute:Na+ symporter
MFKFMPIGFFGLIIGGLIAANSSTVLTHLNWGASYLVHDFYRRFLHKGRNEHHYVLAGRIATVILFLCASGLVFLLDTAKDSFDIIIQVGAGTGLLYLVRWFWWRVNAWCEINAMISSFGFSVLFLILRKLGVVIPTHYALILTVLATTAVWWLTARFGPRTDMQTLVKFYRKVRPFGPGWEPVRKEAGISKEEAKSTGDNFPVALVGWVSGSLTIWSALFTVGNFLYGRMTYALVLFGIFLVSGSVLLRVINRLWAKSPAAPGATTPAS